MSADLLSAAALIAGVLGVIFSVWWPSLQRSLMEDIRANGKAKQLKQLRQALVFQAVPLVLFAAAVVVALAPPWLEVIASVDVGSAYDPVRACFAIVWLALLGLALGAAFVIKSLVQKIRKVV
jgi:hypothetical protein